MTEETKLDMEFMIIEPAPSASDPLGQARYFGFKLKSPGGMVSAAAADEGMQGCVVALGEIADEVRSMILEQGFQAIRKRAPVDFFVQTEHETATSVLRDLTRTFMEESEKLRTERDDALARLDELRRLFGQPGLTRIGDLP